MIHVDCVAGDNEAAINKHGVEQAVAMLEAAGCEDVTTVTTAAPPGFGIHEVGTARMGVDPKKSVLNKWNQTHDIKNLFVMDGSSFVTISCVNPTLTMMAWSDWSNCNIVPMALVWSMRRPYNYNYCQMSYATGKASCALTAAGCWRPINIRRRCWAMCHHRVIK